MADRTTYQNDYEDIDVTIGASDTEPAAAINLAGFRLFAVLLPATLTSTTMTFKDATGGTERTIKDEGGGASAYSITVAADDYVPVKYTNFSAVFDLIPVMGSAEAAERTITLRCRPV